MSKSKVIAIAKVGNLTSLIDVLQLWSRDLLHTVSNDNVFVFGRAGEPVTVRVILDTLTDGSEVYNLNIE